MTAARRRRLCADVTTLRNALTLAAVQVAAARNDHNCEWQLISRDTIRDRVITAILDEAGRELHSAWRCLDNFLWKLQATHRHCFPPVRVEVK